jgi:hypothetical protein
MIENCMQTAGSAKRHCVGAQLGAYLIQSNKGGSLHAPTKSEVQRPFSFSLAVDINSLRSASYGAASR